MLNRTITILVSLLLVVGVLIYFIPESPPDAEAIEVPPALEHTPGYIVVDLKDSLDLSEAFDVLTDEGAQLHDIEIQYDPEKLFKVYVEDQKTYTLNLRQNSWVEVAEPIITLEAFGYPIDPPNDPLYEKQWHMEAMNAPYGWAYSPRGKGIVVAVIDTGVAPVEDLQGTSVLEGKSFVSGEPSPVDENGHGTHVSGTIAQTTNNGIGVTGVAPEATILPIKVLSAQGYGNSDDIAAGIYWAIEQGAQVINMSLGGGYSEVIHKACKEADEASVVVVAAMGNSGREGASFPGGLKETLGVSAVGPDGKLAPYSTWGEGTDISAPGGNKNIPDGGVWQNTISRAGEGEEYAEFQGTSMATPHVAGAAAILLSTGLCDHSCTKRTLLESANGSGAWDPKYGYGQLNLEAGLQSLTTTTWFSGLLAMLLVLLTTWLPHVKNIYKIIAGLIAVLVTLKGLILWVPLVLLVAIAFSLGLFKWTRPVSIGLLCAILAKQLFLLALGPSFGVFILATCVAVGATTLAFNGTENKENTNEDA